MRELAHWSSAEGLPRRSHLPNQRANEGSALYFLTGRISVPLPGEAWKGLHAAG